MPKYVDFQLYTRYVLCSRLQDLTRFKIIAVFNDYNNTLFQIRKVTHNLRNSSIYRPTLLTF